MNFLNTMKMEIFVKIEHTSGLTLYAILFILALFHSPIFEGGFLNVGASMNQMGNSH